MKLNNIVFRLLILLFSSCSSKEAEKEDVMAEDEVIEVVINEITSHDSTYRKRLVPVPYLPPHDFSNEKLIQRDSIKSRLDTVRLYLLLEDSLISVPPMNKERIIGMTHRFETSLNHLDSGFISVLLNLVEPVKKRVVPFESLKSTPTFKVIYSNELGKYSNVEVVGKFTISRVAFNSNIDKACVYTEFVCGGECGGGHLLFLEKRSGKWMVIWQERMWVS